MRPRSQSGFTFIEMLIYTGLLAVIGVSLTLFASRIIRQNAHAQLTTRTLDNTQSAMATITQEIRQSSGIYTPTSTLDTSPGQLSLISALNVPTDEIQTYVDFYIDDDRLYRKREESSAELLTSERVRITNLTFDLLNEGASSPAVRTTITAEPAGASGEAIAQSTVTLTTTTALRSF